MGRSNHNSVSTSPRWMAAAGVVAMAVLGASQAQASIWAGGTGNWSSTVSPGWTTGGVPDAIGAVADFASLVATGTTTTTVDTSARTVGSLLFSGSGNSQRSLTLTNGITYNQDGAGAGYATVSNTNTSATTGNRLNFGSGTSTMADDLLISNTGGSTNTSGSITFSSGFGGSGNLKISNVSNNFDAGKISIGQASTFTGNILIEKGILAVGGSANVLGASTNLLTLGSSGNGSVTLVTTGSTSGVANAITVVSGTGGTALLGSTHNGTTTSSFSGTILMNGDLSITSIKDVGGIVSFTNVLSGAGSLTKVGTGLAQLSAANTFSGNTTVDDGSLTLSNTSELRFKIQNSNTSNRLLGDSTVNLNGLLRLDISSLTDTAGTWNLVDVAALAETFGGTFGLAFVGGPTFTNGGGGVFTSGDWTFTTSNGNLTLVPEPASVSMLGLMSFSLLGRRKRA